MLIRQITEVIGDTPLFEISPKIHGLNNINLYAKLELLNPFGSVKDRSAWNVLKNDIENISLNGQKVIEASSGNMGKAIQLFCSMYGVEFKVVTNRIKVRETKQILQLLGTKVDEHPGLSECPDPTDPNDPLAYIEQIMSSAPGEYFHTSQYTNEKNIEAHYKSTGKEIFNDIGNVDFFVGGLGTSGSTQGAGQFLKEKNPMLKNIGVIATKGQHLPGIRNADEMQEVGLFKREFYDDIVEVNIDESIDAMLILIRKLGIMAGPTSGGSFAASLKYLRTIDSELDRKYNAVFIACDRVELYLSYLQKHRPEIFGLSTRKDSVKTITSPEVASARQISTEEVGDWLKQDNALIIDMRGSLAFKASHIPGSINISADIMEEIADWGVPFSNNHNILFVCPVGDQSKKFAAFFNKKGINSASLIGGFVAWRDTGKRIERTEQKDARDLITARI